MPRWIVLAAAALTLTRPAVAVLTNDALVTSQPIIAENWATGWGASDISGWDYVGSVNGASGVYLGNGWVISAGHVGAGNFSLGGVTYDAVAGSAVSITSAAGTADLVLFQISTAPALPSLDLRQSDPVTFSRFNSGSTVVMIGNGGGGKSWGANVVTDVDDIVSLSGYNSTSFSTNYGTTTLGNRSVTNSARAVTGDSGGAGFIFNASSGEWELAGVMAAVSSDGDTYLVQLNEYAAQIQGIIAAPVPEPTTLGLLALSFVLFGLRRKFS